MMRAKSSRSRQHRPNRMSTDISCEALNIQELRRSKVITFIMYVLSLCNWTACHLNGKGIPAGSFPANRSVKYQHIFKNIFSFFLITHIGCMSELIGNRKVGTVCVRSLLTLTVVHMSPPVDISFESIGMKTHHCSLWASIFTASAILKWAQLFYEWGKRSSYTALTVRTCEH